MGEPRRARQRAKPLPGVASGQPGTPAAAGGAATIAGVRSRGRMACGQAMTRATSDRLTWLGHATALLELAGARLLTDPVLRDRVAHLRRRVPPPAPPGRLDAVLLSHLHHDHLDLPSLRRLEVAGVVV